RVDVTHSVAVGMSLFDMITAGDFQARNLLLALRAGEPYRIALALAWETAHSSTAGGRSHRRTARLLAAARALAERLGHPHALGAATLAAGIVEFMEGRFRTAFGILERADAILRDHCTGVAW